VGEPLRWRTPLRIFVNSMSDLFHPDVPVSFIAEVGQTMRLAHWHTFQVVTKRHRRMRELLSDELRWLGELPNVWFGVSVENRRHGLPRIDTLRATPALVRFLSIEPLLEDLGPLDLGRIDWVIVGGESGPGARPMEEQWVLSILRQCKKAGVPFFFKQWGGLHKTKKGRSLRGRTYNDVPELLATIHTAPAASQWATRLRSDTPTRTKTTGRSTPLFNAPSTT